MAIGALAIVFISVPGEVGLPAHLTGAVGIVVQHEPPSRPVRRCVGGNGQIMGGTLTADVGFARGSLHPAQGEKSLLGFCKAGHRAAIGPRTLV